MARETRRDTVTSVDEVVENEPVMHHVGRSFSWAVLGQAAQRVASLLSTLVLARFFLDRADFGVYSIAVTVSVFLLALNDVGVSFAIVRERDDEALAALLPTARTMTLAVSVVLYVLLFVSAPGIVALFHAPSGSPAVGIIRLLGLQLVVDGWIAVPAALLSRDLRERKRALAEGAGLSASLVVIFVLASRNAGAWSLAGGQLTGVVVTALLLAAGWRPRCRFGFDRRLGPSLARFGVPMIAAAAVGELVLNSDYVVVNRYLGVTSAGAYFIAFNVANWPVTVISYALRRSAVAGFARVDPDPDAQQRAFRRAVLLLVTATLPMALLLGLFARELLAVLYGRDWLMGATALTFLAGVGVLRLFVSLASGFLAAAGRSSAILATQLVWWVVSTVAMAWAAPRHGLVGVGVAQLVVALAGALPLLVWQLRRAGIRPHGIVADLARPVVAGAALVVAGVVVRSPFEAPLLRLLAGGAVAAMAYVLVMAPGMAIGRFGDLRRQAGRTS
jgi:PST family polysaccharide transporter